jgi:hypothetical protein
MIHVPVTSAAPANCATLKAATVNNAAKPVLSFMLPSLF